MSGKIRKQCYYDARVNDINLEDITSSEKNANILRALRDEGLGEIFLTGAIEREGNFFVIREGDDLGWLGYFIGESKYLEMLAIISLPGERARIDALMEGIFQNKSIQRLILGTDDALGDFIDPMTQFIGNSNNLLGISFVHMNIERQQAEDIVSMLRQIQCNPMNEISFLHSNISEEGLDEIYRFFRSQPQIELLDLKDTNIGRNGCEILGNMLSSWHAPNLEDLDLDDNAIDDMGLQALVEGLVNCCNLEILKLSGNRSITAAGLRSLSTLFQSGNCTLEELYLKRMNIGDDGVAALAEGLVGNKSLKQLHFDVDVAGITEVGWSAFSKLLCDTSSINNTYLSNHTLKNIGGTGTGIPEILKAHLGWNTLYDKHDVAILKILRHHREFDIDTFFQWKLKFLPLVVKWFDRARQCAPENVHAVAYLQSSITKMDSMKLSSVYKFVRDMPMLVLDGYQSQTPLRRSKRRKLLNEKA